jgi:uncharacterized protein YprB with RNaseH-like and TPR domain
VLRNTFCHVAGVGPRSESRLWSKGYHTWDCVLTGPRESLPSRLRSRLPAELELSAAELAAGNAGFFQDRLPPHERWRIFPDFRGQAAYFDIETTGLRPDYSTITTIALFDGRKIRHYIYGQNLDEFVDDIREYKLLITYNGQCFDIPFVERFFGIEIKAAHIDLRYVLKSLGYTGGLKGCEKKLGIDRGELDGVDGYFAVLLWFDYAENGNERALETLLAYNIEDVVNLERLMVTAYNLKLKRTPFLETKTFGLPSSPRLPFKPDRRTIERIREKYFRF